MAMAMALALALSVLALLTSLPLRHIFLLKQTALLQQQ